MVYIGKRLLQAAVSLLGVSTIVFFVLRLTGDPAQLMVPQNATAEDILVLRQSLGLDRPVGVQYLDYLTNLLQGDLGYSYVQNQPVMQIIMERFPYTVDLAIAALLLSLAAGISIGLLTAVYRGTWIEKTLTPIVFVGQSMPAFWTGILLIMLFSVRMRWLPSSGADSWSALVLPAVTLASLSVSTIARMTRSGVLEQLGQDYVRTAHSKGVSLPRLLGRHVLRNAAIPILTVAGMETANLLGGAVITESIFAWPGIGQLTIQAINARDFPLVQAIVFLGAFIYIVINLITDLLYGWVDPRIKVARGTAS